MVMSHLFYAEPAVVYSLTGRSLCLDSKDGLPFSAPQRCSFKLRLIPKPWPLIPVLSPFPFFPYTIPVKPRNARAIRPAVIRPMAVPW